MSADWQAGDRAVCVDDSPNPNPGTKTCPNGYLVAGNVYLVADVREAITSWGRRLGRPVLIIAGKPVAWRHFSGEAGWREDRFRKLVPACGLARRHAEGVES